MEGIGALIRAHRRLVIGLDNRNFAFYSVDLFQSFSYDYTLISSNLS